MGNIQKEEAMVEFHGQTLRPRESIRLKRRLQLGGRAPPFMMGHPQPKMHWLGCALSGPTKPRFPLQRIFASTG